MNKTLTLMVQGTTSDAGKSVIVAGLCRLLARRDVSVAPFKPQNMALNSAVTADGGEIGRAQAVQAQACMIQPHTDMNPILLKPSSDTGAQVIVHGKALSNMEAKSYHDYKSTAMQAVLESHSRLQQDYDVIVVEGAGSPAEINLREGDIANMGFAEAVDCPVIIVADIDRGGVFAHLVGTLALLSQSEQDRVIGFIINRFRGDIALLQPGLDWLERKTNKPVLGVIPYLKNFFLDAEDAIESSQTLNAAIDERLNVVVPVLSRISNHTDFDALRLRDDVNLQFVAVENRPPPCDLIILPGSKNTRSDMSYLQQNGWVEGMNKHLRYGGKLLGICGGFQMLGNMIHDPKGIEQKAGSTEGFGLIDMNTTLNAHKQLALRDGLLHFNEKDVPIGGYEIHCGVSSFNQIYAPLITLNDAGKDGVISLDNNVAGTYLHGLFDKASACEALLRWAGMKHVNENVDLNTRREEQLNRLADCLEGNVSFNLCDNVISDLF